MLVPARERARDERQPAARRCPGGIELVALAQRHLLQRAALDIHDPDVRARAPRLLANATNLPFGDTAG